MLDLEIIPRYKYLAMDVILLLVVCSWLGADTAAFNAAKVLEPTKIYHMG
jgi:hypothetical protein